jgi:hypothetical protein
MTPDDLEPLDPDASAMRTLDDHARAAAEGLRRATAVAAPPLGRRPFGTDGPPGTYDHRALGFAGWRSPKRPVIVGLAAAVIVVAVGVVVTRPSTHHHSNGLAAAETTTAPPTTTVTPLTASSVAQMLVAGQFADIASKVEPPSRRSADQVILEQAWGDFTNAYGTLLWTGTQDEDAFPPPAPPGSSGAAGSDAVDETVLHMSHGLILLRVTLGPDGALVHVELWPGPAFFADVGQTFGF